MTDDRQIEIVDGIRVEFARRSREEVAVLVLEHLDQAVESGSGKVCSSEKARRESTHAGLSF